MREGLGDASKARIVGRERVHQQIVRVGQVPGSHTYYDLPARRGYEAFERLIAFEQISEALAAKTDFAPFVAVAGAANAAVTADGQQVCVDGLKHGSRYSIVLRQGLPSAVGESPQERADRRPHE